MSNSDNSVFDEPQFQRGAFAGDSTDPPQETSDTHNTTPLPVGQGAWDEPALSPGLAGERPAHVETYAHWLAEGIKRTSLTKSWSITLALALGSGLWAIVGALLSQIQSSSAGGLLLIIVIGPLAEEMLKASAALMTIEKWPYIFKSPVQILLCCIAAALGFAILENILYLHLYIKDPTASLILWRWTVCVALHTGGSTIVALGLIRIWRHAMTTGTAPRVSLGTPYIITAAVIHGSYNFLAILANPLFH